MKNIKIRILKVDEREFLEDMLYESVYQPDEAIPVPREVVNVPRVRAYIDRFGEKKGDYCFVADLDNRIIGAVWVRILSGEIKGYGNIDDETPEFAISLFKEYRGQGIGTELMLKMLELLKSEGYRQASLSVQKENYATRLYKKLGFEIVSENSEDYLMVINLKNKGTARFNQKEKYL